MAWGQLGDLVGLGACFPLGAHPPGAGVQDRQQVHLAAAGADRAADGLSVHGSLRQQPGPIKPGSRRSGPALLALVRGDGGKGIRRARRQGGEVAVQRGVEGLGVDTLEDPGKVRVPGGRIRLAHGSRRPPRTASVSCEQPAAHPATAAGESCRAAVNAQTARPSTNSSRMPPAQPRAGSGTWASHWRRQHRRGHVRSTQRSQPGKGKGLAQ